MALYRDHDRDSAFVALQVRSAKIRKQHAWTSTATTLAQVTYRLASLDHLVETYFGLGRGLHRVRDTYLPLWMDSGGTRSQAFRSW